MKVETIMIDQQGDLIVLECDSCPETIEASEEDGWNELWPRAKRLGWTSRKIGTEWVHSCANCGVDE